MMIFGIITEANNRKYYKAIGNPSILNRTDNPYSGLSFSADKKTLNSWI